MAALSKRALFANIFGTFGYISCLLQWLFVALLYLPLLLDNQQVQDFLLPQAQQSAPTIVSGPPSPWLIGFAIIFTVAMLILTVVILLRAPIAIARSGKKVTQKTAETIVPIMAHRPLPATKKRRLTHQLIKLVKLSIVIIPFLLSLVIVYVSTILPAEVIVFCSAILALLSLGWFLAQYIIARILKVHTHKLV